MVLIFHCLIYFSMYGVMLSRSYFFFKYLHTGSHSNLSQGMHILEQKCSTSLNEILRVDSKPNIDGQEL